MPADATFDTSPHVPHNTIVMRDQSSHLGNFSARTDWFARFSDLGPICALSIPLPRFEMQRRSRPASRVLRIFLSFCGSPSYRVASGRFMIMRSGAWPMSRSVERVA
jgi:hypothetical protein